MPTLKDSTPSNNISRRNFLGVEPRRSKRNWHLETDVLVVGSGAAGSVAALMAHEQGAETVIVEKSFLPGGTTAKSGGRIWIPNNHFMRNQGIGDNRDDCLRYMARLSYPTTYNPKDRYVGLTDNNYRLIAAFYDNGAKTIEKLMEMQAINLQPWFRAGELMADYYPDIPENAAPQGRGLECPSNEHLGGRGGAQMVREFQAAIHRRHMTTLLEHRVTGLHLNSDRVIVGAEMDTPDGTISVRTRKGIVFGSGGFTHNEEMLKDHVRGPIFGGCAAKTAAGDFIAMATSAGARLANMNHVWGRPLILEQVLQNRETPDGAWIIGDSLIQVNLAGKRVTNEMMPYNERNQVHYDWDAANVRYSNLISFVIYDENCRVRFGTDYAGIAVVLKPGLSSSYIIKGETLKELAANIQKRLGQLGSRFDKMKLQTDFVESLNASIERFNQFANNGYDEDFNRGETLYDQQAMRDFMEDKIAPKGPNSSMAPISSKGPYYCVMICPGTLDTKGGPKINEHAQILDRNDAPIPGLYGAGNCIGSPAAQAYWAGGTTLGLAMTFGAIAGHHAANRKPTTQNIAEISTS